MPDVHELRSAADFDALLEASRERPVALLKHSVACPISSRGRHEFLRLDDEGDPPLYTVIVQAARDVSRTVAERLGVRHETPQVILVKDGEAVFHASHFGVTAGAVREALREARGWAS